MEHALFESERMTLAEALAMYTVEAAYAARAEDQQKRMDTPANRWISHKVVIFSGKLSSIQGLVGSVWVCKPLLRTNLNPHKHPLFHQGVDVQNFTSGVPTTISSEIVS